MKTSAMLKMLGLIAAVSDLPDGFEDKEIPMADLVKGIKGIPVDELVKGLDRDALGKALGVELPPIADPKKPEGLDDLPADVRKHIAALEDKTTKALEAVAGIVKQRDDADAEALEARRVKVEKRTGIKIEKETVSAPVLDAYEAAADAHDARLRKMGIFELKGHSEEADGTALAEVKKAVREQLGREPKDIGEEMRVRKGLYEANPGLLRAVMQEDRAARVAAVS